MKNHPLIISSLLLVLWPCPLFAQDIPVPAPDPSAEVPEATVNPENSAEVQPIAAETVISETASAESPSEAAPSGSPNDEQPSPEPSVVPENLIAQQLITFFDGLDAAVSAHSGDCQAMSDAFREYCNTHGEWIRSLDYATTNIDMQTIQVIHEKSIEFGKKLSVCYEQNSIPELLRRYAGLGEAL